MLRWSPDDAAVNVATLCQAADDRADALRTIKGAQAMILAGEI